MINKLKFYLFACRFLFIGIAVLLAISKVSYSEPVDYDAQIKELKRKIEKTEQKTGRIRESMKEDNCSFISADSVHQITLKRLRNEKDTIFLKSMHEELRIDSLSQQIDSIQRKYENFEANQVCFRRQMINVCNEIPGLLKTLPPANLKNHISALEFLKSEITGNAVENPEAIERLWQILFTVNDMAQSVDVYTAASPVASIAGDVYYIRMGLVWLGVVDQKGTNAFIWNGDTVDSHEQWLPVTDIAEAAAMLKCAKIRQGSAVPEIIGLPFRQVLVHEGVYGTEVKE